MKQALPFCPLSVPYNNKNYELNPCYMLVITMSHLLTLHYIMTSQTFSFNPLRTIFISIL